MISQKEIIEALRFGNEIALTRIADDIEAEGIASEPSVDALIGELDSRPRYCAQSDSAIDAILDKYRGQK